MSEPSRFLEGETVVEEFRPHWNRILREIIILLIAVLVAVVVVALFGGALQTWGLVLVVVVALFVTVPNILDWLTSEYVITDHRVISKQGFLKKQTREVPMDVINTVAYQQSAWEKMFNSGDLLIESAGEHGQSVFADIVDPAGKKEIVYELRTKRLAGMSRGATPHASTSVAEQLSILSGLLDEGKLTAEEYETEKARLLGQTGSSSETEEGTQ